jgi:hypothetical protein
MSRRVSTARLTRMGKAASRAGRQVMVFVHVVSSVAWLTLALAQFALFAHGSVADPAIRESAYTMAVFLDHSLLQVFAEMSAFTGLMLSALTAWGLFRHWWVLIKFVISIGMFVFAIGWLGQWGEAAAAASAQGVALPLERQLIGNLAMVAGLALAAWLSVAKPGGRVRRGSVPVKTPSPPQWLWFALLTVPLIDILVLGRPMAELLVAIVVPIVAGVRDRRAGRAHEVAARTSPRSTASKS